LSPAPAVDARGYVLSRVPYRDKDMVARLALEDEGVVALLARGARGSRRRFGGSLDDYAGVHLRYRPSSRGLGTLLEARRMSAAEPDPADLAAFAVRAHTAELVLALVEEGHPTRFPFRLFAWVQEALAGPVERQERRARAAWVLARVRVIVLHQQGRLPDLHECTACHRPFPEGGPVHFSSEQGLRCDACAADAPAGALRPFGELAELRALFSGEPFEGERAPGLGEWLAARIRDAVGRGLRSEDALGRFV